MGRAFWLHCPNPQSFRPSPASHLSAHHRRPNARVCYRPGTGLGNVAFTAVRFPSIAGGRACHYPTWIRLRLYGNRLHTSLPVWVRENGQHGSSSRTFLRATSLQNAHHDNGAASSAEPQTCQENEASYACTSGGIEFDHEEAPDNGRCASGARTCGSLY